MLIRNKTTLFLVVAFFTLQQGIWGSQQPGIVPVQPQPNQVQSIVINGLIDPDLVVDLNSLNHQDINIDVARRSYFHLLEAQKFTRDELNNANSNLFIDFVKKKYAAASKKPNPLKRPILNGIFLSTAFNICMLPFYVAVKGLGWFAFGGNEEKKDKIRQDYIDEQKYKDMNYFNKSRGWLINLGDNTYKWLAGVPQENVSQETINTLVREYNEQFHDDKYKVNQDKDEANHEITLNTYQEADDKEALTRLEYLTSKRKKVTDFFNSVGGDIATLGATTMLYMLALKIEKFRKVAEKVDPKGKAAHFLHKGLNFLAQSFTKMEKNFKKFANDYLINTSLDTYIK